MSTHWVEMAKISKPKGSLPKSMIFIQLVKFKLDPLPNGLGLDLIIKYSLGLGSLLGVTLVWLDTIFYNKSIIIKKIFIYIF